MITEEEMLDEMLSATCFDQEELKKNWYELYYEQKLIAFTLFENSWQDALYCIEDARASEIETFPVNGYVNYSNRTGLVVVVPYDFQG